MSDFWEGFKDAFKTDAQKDKERNEKLLDAASRDDELIKKLKELDNEYIETLEPFEPDYDLEKLFPSDSGQYELEYPKITDEYIQDMATKEVSYDKEKEKNNLLDKYTKQEKGIDEDVNDTEKDYIQDKQKQETEFDILSDQAKKNSIEKGLSRSSIIIEQLRDLTDNKDMSNNEIKDAYLDTMTVLNNELDGLEKAKSTALNEMDMKYAEEISSRIHDLRIEREEMVKDVEQINNKIRERKNDFETDRAYEIEDFLEEKKQERVEKDKAQAQYESLYGYTGEKQENYAKRYDLAYDFYMSLDTEIALQALGSSPNMKYYLGNNYNKLVKDLESKDSQERIF